MTFTREGSVPDVLSLEKATREVFKDLPGVQGDGELILQVCILYSGPVHAWTRHILLMGNLF